MKKVLIGIVIMVMVVLSGCSGVFKQFGTSGNKQTPTVAQSSLGKAFNFELYDIKGEKVKLSDYRGKTVVLNFFATWCGPCKAELPGFLAVMSQMKADKGVKFIFIDIGESREDVKKFIEFKKYDTLNPVLDVLENAADKYGIRGIPSTFIINKDGNIVFHHEGIMEPKDLKNAIMLYK